jgi:hypothetical protein
MSVFPSGQTFLTNVATYFQFLVNAETPQVAALAAQGGTFTLTEDTPLAVADTAVTADSLILIGLKTVGGTVGALPAVQSLTAGTGFSIKGTSGDTSVYTYLILG